MTDQLRQGSLTESYPDHVGAGQGLTHASVAGWRQQKWHQELEREWEGRLSDLRQCICELLIKNQQLRESVESATNHRHQELDNECDQSVGRSRS